MFLKHNAILIIHGFLGGTYDEEELANFLELNRNFDVFQYTLPGHEKNFSKVTYDKWVSYSKKEIEWLISKGYDSIYLIGHSMGGVIATLLATEYKQVKKLVLAAPAFQYLHVVKNNINLHESLNVTPKVIKTYGGSEIVARFLKLNPQAIKEFMSFVKKYYDCPKKLNTTLLILQGKNDDIVPLSSSEYVYDSALSKDKKLIYLNNVTHDIFRCKRKYEIFDIILKFLKYGLKSGIDNL